jgi:cell division protein FtsQ
MSQMTARQRYQNDPAPSLWVYRLNRAMLTPLFRVMVRLVLPVAALCLGVWLYFSDADRREAVIIAKNDIADSIKNRPEFQLTVMSIDGASRSVSEDIREILAIDFPISWLDLDLDQIRDTVAGLDPVQHVTAHYRKDGILQLDVVERVPAIVWRTRQSLELLDATGAPVGQVKTRDKRADLPLVAGSGAAKVVPEALAVIAAAQPIADRVRGLVRIGERRWDMMLDKGQRILLPAKAPVQAIERIIVLHQANDLLARDLTVIDMRISARPSLRLSDNALNELVRIKPGYVEK